MRDQTPREFIRTGRVKHAMWLQISCGQSQLKFLPLLNVIADVNSNHFSLELEIRRRKLKKVILIVVISFVAWKYYQKEQMPHPPIKSDRPSLIEKSSQSTQQVTPQIEARFQCDGRQHCSQMNSRAEAEFFIKNCPNTKMDGDNDGIPCENDSRF